MDINIKELDNLTLRQFYMNARMTCMGSLDHNKRERNWAGAEKYAEELIRRHIIVPTYEEVKANGIFNGIGSF